MEHDLQNAPDQVRSVADTFVTGAPVTSTERIVSQREVEAAGERFRSVMEAVGDMLWITSSTGVILEERSSPGNNNLKEKNFLELFHPADKRESLPSGRMQWRMGGRTNWRVICSMEANIVFFWSVGRPCVELTVIFANGSILASISHILSRCVTPSASCESMSAGRKRSSRPSPPEFSSVIGRERSSRRTRWPIPFLLWESAGITSRWRSATGYFNFMMRTTSLLRWTSGPCSAFFAAKCWWVRMY